MKTQSVYIQKSLCLLIFVLISMPAFLSAQEGTYNKELERLEKKLPELSGKEKLDTLHYLVEYTAVGYPAKYRYFLRTLEEEAIKQNNINYQAFVKVEMVKIYFYQFDTDSIFIAAAIAEEFARTHKKYNSLFSVQQMIIQRYAYQGEYGKATKKGKELFDEAKELNNYFGMAMASAGIGNTYSAMGMKEEAIKYLKEGLLFLRNVEEETGRMSLSFYQAIVMDYYTKGDHDNTILYADTLQAEIDEYARKKSMIDLLPYRYCAEYRLAGAYIEKKELQKAYPHIIKADSLHNLLGANPYYICEANALKARYYIQLGEYNTASKYLESAIGYVKENNITGIQAFNFYTSYAAVLLLEGRYKESATIFQEAADMMRETYANDLHTQINQLRTLYDLDKMELQIENDKLQLSIAHNRLTIFIMATVLLLVIVVIVVYNMRRTRKKNISLVRRIREQGVLEEKIEEQQIELSKMRLILQTMNTSSSGEAIEEDSLIVKLRNFIKENPIYTNAEINRKELAELLGTNENYLRTAIKEKLGYTFNEYINELRLEHAKKMLESPKNEYTIEGIALESGFGTRSTFYRKFRSKYNITPDEYRKAIKNME